MSIFDDFFDDEQHRSPSWSLTSLEDRRPEGFRWHWSINHGDGRVSLYRTNEDGEGMFSRNPTENAWSQSKGTLQFQLPDDYGAAKAKIIRHWLRLGVELIDATTEASTFEDSA